MKKLVVFTKLIGVLACFGAMAVAGTTVSNAAVSIGLDKDQTKQWISLHGTDSRSASSMQTALLDLAPADARSCADSVLREYFNTVLQKFSPAGVVLERVDISVSFRGVTSYSICALGPPRLPDDFQTGSAKLAKMRVLDTNYERG